MNTTDKVASKADDAAHSAAADKAKGHTKEVIGSIKTKVGSVFGDRELEAEGRAQNAEGKVDRMKGEIKEKLDDAKDMVKAGVSVVKDKIDELRR
ncbi:MAG: CsbD family protein [Panacagrimonas sp.]